MIERAHRWKILGVFLLAFGLRLIVIDSRGIFYDDAFSIFLAQREIPNIIYGTAGDTMPPLYYLFLHFWIQAGTSLAWIRLLGVVLSLVDIALLYLFIRELGGKRAGLIAAFLGAISPFLFYHAQEVRMYTLLAAGQLGYAWCMARIFRSGSGSSRRWEWIGLIGFGALAMYTHNLAIFTLCVPGFLLAWKRSWRLLIGWVAAMLVIGLVTLPWLVYIPGQVAKIQRAFWTLPPGLVEVIQSLAFSVAGLPLPGNWLVVGMLASIWVITLVGLGLLRLRGKVPEFKLAVFFVIIPPVLLFIASYLMRPVFVPRGFLASILIFLGLAGIVIAQTPSKGLRGLILGGFMISSAIGLPIQATFDEFPRSQFKEAGEYLVGHYRDGDVIVHDNKLSHFPVHFYFPQLRQFFLPDTPGSPNDTLAVSSQEALNLYPVPDLAGAARDADRVFYVVFERAISEYRQAGFDQHPSLSWLDSRFRTRSITRFNDLLIYEYVR